MTVENTPRGLLSMQSGGFYFHFECVVLMWLSFRIHEEKRRCIRMKRSGVGECSRGDTRGRKNIVARLVSRVYVGDAKREEQSRFNS